MENKSNIEVLKRWVKKHGAWNNSHTFYSCLVCKKRFSGSPSDKSKYCSRDCIAIAMRLRMGEAAPNWKGGKSQNNICLDCGTHITFTAKRCKKCAAVLMPHVHIKERPWLRTREAIKKSLRRHPVSSLETKFQEIINGYNLPYKYVGNGKFFIERKNPDFININGEKKAVEVYARKHKEKMKGITINQWKNERKKVFAKYGWELLFFDETELNEKNILSVLKGGDKHS